MSTMNPCPWCGGTDGQAAIVGPKVVAWRCDCDICGPEVERTNFTAHIGGHFYVSDDDAKSALDNWNFRIQAKKAP